MRPLWPGGAVGELRIFQVLDGGEEAGMPASAIEHEHKLLAGTGPDLARKLR